MGGPSLTSVLETVLYCTSKNEEATRVFYTDVLGLRDVAGSAYRLGDHVFLVFNRDHTVDQDSPPAHGATGVVHSCFRCPPDDYEAWKSRLQEHDVEIVQELTWDEGIRSFYFEDPAGNMLEIAEGDMWPK